MVGHHLVARDGTTLLIRRAAAEDETALSHLYEELSPESAYHRFLGFPSRQSPWHDEIGAPGGTACTLVAEAGGGLVGVASYRGDPARPRDAEVAFTVADCWQGRGLGTLLLEQLATEARAAGMNRFLAETSADNSSMLAVFRDAGFPVTSTTRDGVVEARIALDVEGGFGELHAKRAGTAAHESLRPFFLPSGIAVIGASRSPSKVGRPDLQTPAALGIHRRPVPGERVRLRGRRSPSLREGRRRACPVDLAVDRRARGRRGGGG